MALTFEFTGLRGFLRRSGGMMGSAWCRSRLLEKSMKIPVMKPLLFVAAVSAFAGAAMLYFVEGNWYGALGWLLTGGYQIVQALETPNVEVS